LPTKHTKHPKEKKPVLPVLVCFRVFGGQGSPLLQRLHDPESRIDQDQDQEHEQDTVIVDSKVVACFTDTHIAQMLGYLNITGLDLALLLNFKNARLDGNASCAREKLANTTRLIFMLEPYPCYPCNPWSVCDFEKIVASLAPKESPK
jgi:hypothetical protein